jgi:hypothetical protein
VLDHRLLPPGIDLYGAFIKALAAHVDNGNSFTPAPIKASQSTALL